MHACIYVYMYVCIGMHACMYLCMYVCMYVCIGMHVMYVVLRRECGVVHVLDTQCLAKEAQHVSYE